MERPSVGQFTAKTLLPESTDFESPVAVQAVANNATSKATTSEVVNLIPGCRIKSRVFISTEIAFSVLTTVH